MGDIVNIKLVTGEDMFAELLDRSEMGMTVRNPMVSTEIQGPDGNPMMGLYPYLVHSDTNVCVLNNNSVTTTTKISPIVTSFYHNSNYFSDQLISDQMERIKEANIYINESIQLDSLDEEEFLVDLNNMSFLVH
jgi:hypothetical protein